MKTIFDQSARDEFVIRIHLVNENSTPAWGKMNVYQMTKHCTIWNDWVLGNQDFIYKQELLGKIFGKMALKTNTRDDRPLSKNMPAGKAFTVKEKEGDLNALLLLWAEQIESYRRYRNEFFIHDFFGKMTKEQIGVFAFKHNDHHLRQFNV